MSFEDERHFVLEREEIAHGVIELIRANWERQHALQSTLACVLYRYSGPRTLRQNMGYFGDLRTIEAQAWLDGRMWRQRAWHDHFRRQFIGWEDYSGGMTLPISTTKLNARQFDNYRNEVCAYAVNELDVIFPY